MMLGSHRYFQQSNRSFYATLREKKDNFTGGSIRFPLGNLKVLSIVDMFRNLSRIKDITFSVI